MMDTATKIRIAYFDALQTKEEVVNEDLSVTIKSLGGLEYNGAIIPIFDEEVVGATAKISNAEEVYILIQGQQTIDDSVQTVCDYRLISDITVKVVTKFKGVGKKSMCEEIGFLAMNLIKGKRDISKLTGIDKIRLDVSRSIIEQSDSQTAFSKVMIFRNYINN